MKVRAGLRDKEDVIFLVSDHKKKILPTFFRECQTQFFGKRGHSLLGVWAIYQGCTSFYDIVSSGYSAQDALQTQAAISIVRDFVCKDFPSVKRIVLQSDNASGYSSAEDIRSIYQMNQSSSNLPIVEHWINTEAQKGKTILDTRFSFVGKQFQKFVASGRIWTQSRKYSRHCVLMVEL